MVYGFSLTGFWFLIVFTVSRSTHGTHGTHGARKAENVTQPALHFSSRFLTSATAIRSGA